jgi:hypothetical protein
MEEKLNSKKQSSTASRASTVAVASVTSYWWFCHDISPNIFVIKIFHSHDLKKPSNYASCLWWIMSSCSVYDVSHRFTHLTLTSTTFKTISNLKVN